MILIPRHCELDEMQQVLAAETNGAGLVAVAVAAQTPSGARDRQQSQRQREKQRAELQRLPAGSVQLHLCALPAPDSSCQLHLGRTMKSQGGQTVWVWPKICEQACCMIKHQEVLLQTPRDGGLSLVLYPAGSSTDAAS